MYAGHGQLERSVGESRWTEEVSRREPVYPLNLFRHEEALHVQEDQKPLDCDYLVNRINYIHFAGKKAFAVLNHPKHRASIMVNVFPEPCSGKEIICKWADDSFQGSRVHEFSLKHLVIDDQRDLLVVPAQISHRLENGFGLNLPCESFLSGRRSARRYNAPGIDAEIIQDGWTATGTVIDFNSRGIRVKVRPANANSLHWFNCGETAMLNLKREGRIFFSGRCNCLRNEAGYEEREILLTPAESSVKRFPKNQTRNPRQQLVPAPVISFIHPLMNRRVSFTVSDISTSGMSLFEREEDACLLPGLIIDDLCIEMVGGARFHCTAQVIHRGEENERGIKCGIAILDMDVRSYSQFSNVLSNAIDPQSHISGQVDIENLWEFFFKSGFIYSAKYKMLNNSRDSFKETYRKIYNENPDISRHFTYEENGKIYGHISIIRAYSKTWMIHHHAAIAHDKKRPGFIVLKHLMHNLNDMHRLPSARMDYVLCYYRPENQFPARVFGGFAEELKDSQGCSVDKFAYLPYTRLSLAKKLPQGWTLDEATAGDLWELNNIYSNTSGGLLLNALDLKHDGNPGSELDDSYGSIGLKRHCKSYSLCDEGVLKAVILVNESDLGINLSELLNSIQVLVLDPEALPWSVLSVAIGRLTSGYQGDKVPLMFYPHTYTRLQNIPSEKEYEAWVLNCGQGHLFMEYMQRRFRIRF